MCPPPSSLWQSESFFSTTRLFFPGRAERPLKGASSVPASLVDRRGRKWACFVGLINNRGWSTHERGCNCYSVEGEERKSLACSFLRKGASEQAKELWTEGSVCFWIKARCEWGGLWSLKRGLGEEIKLGGINSGWQHQKLLSPTLTCWHPGVKTLDTTLQLQDAARGLLMYTSHPLSISALFFPSFTFHLSYPISVPKPYNYKKSIITSTIISKNSRVDKHFKISK